MGLEKYFLPEDGDEGCSFSLNEREWHSYLAAIDSEAGKFFKIFIRTKHISNHLDLIFSMMKWRKIVLNNEIIDDNVEIVTFHRNPINIASKAIFFFVEKIWDLLISDSKNMTAATCWHFSKLINVMQREMLSGIANVDSCEFLLSICHFKNVLAAVDESIFALNQLPEMDGYLKGFQKDFSTALFDIRELAWQSILLCKISEKRYDDRSHFD